MRKRIKIACRSGYLSHSFCFWKYFSPYFCTPESYKNRPAKIYMNAENGSICAIEYIENLEYHNLEGPAYINYGLNQDKNIKNYYINGKNLSKQEFFIEKIKQF